MKKALLLSTLLLILNWVISPHDPLFLDQTHPSKSLDAYWSETQLGTTELESLLSDDSCQNEKKSFLSCVNAANQMADRFSMILDSDFNLRKMADPKEKTLTEKEILLNWGKAYDRGVTSPRFAFSLVFHELLGLEKNPARRPGLVAAGINGFFSVYRDPHTYIIPVQYYENVLAKNEFQNNHTGFLLRKHKNEIYIRKVFENSPASEAGLMRGDRLVRINQSFVQGMAYETLLEFFRQASPQSVHLEVERKWASKPEHLTIKLIPAEKNYPNVTAEMLSSAFTGLVTVHKFSKNTCSAVKTQLIQLKEQGLKNLVLDLRDNPGGQVDEAACLIGLFVKQGTLLFEMVPKDHKSGSREKYTSTESPLFQGRIAVLINSGSASAAEIVAGSLKDLNRAILVGEKTFGKGSFQDGRMWGQSSQIALFESSGLYYFPSGWTPQLVGIEPDIKVASQGFEVQREDELYFNPLLPFSNKQPETVLTLRTDEDMCQGQELDPSKDSDLQFMQAQKFLNCSLSHQPVGQN